MENNNYDSEPKGCAYAIGYLIGAFIVCMIVICAVAAFLYALFKTTKWIWLLLLALLIH